MRNKHEGEGGGGGVLVGVLMTMLVPPLWTYMHSESCNSPCLSQIPYYISSTEYGMNTEKFQFLHTFSSTLRVTGDKKCYPSSKDTCMWRTHSSLMEISFYLESVVNYLRLAMTIQMGICSRFLSRGYKRKEGMSTFHIGINVLLEDTNSLLTYPWPQRWNVENIEQKS